MTQEIKDEALEQLGLDIKFGFENEGELFDSIRDMFYNEDNFDEDWLRQTISERYKQHQRDSLTWERPNDFDRLAKTFDRLIQEKMVCLHNAGFTRQDGEGDCRETIERLTELGIKAIGFCYYHSQDLARAVDKQTRSLLLGFGSSAEEETETLYVAGKIVKALKENDFEISWAGTVDQRIEIKNINWQKIPDNEDWSSERVINILTKPNQNKKRFWF